MSKLSKYFRSPTGFTLIELLIAVAIITIISVVGIASFNNANRRNATNQAAADITSLARKLRTDATSGLKPTTTCKAAGVVLEGYYLTIQRSPGGTSGTTYNFGAACFDGAGNFEGTNESKNLPIGLVFNHQEAFAFQTTIFTFDGDICRIPGVSNVAFSARASYTNCVPTSATAGHWVSVKYADNSEENFIYFSSTGLVCYQKVFPTTCAAN